MTNRISLLTFLTAAMAVLVMGCSDPTAEPPVEATAAEAAATVPPPASTAAASPAPTPTPEPFAYDPNKNMFLLMSSAGHPLEYTLAALTRAQEERDASQVPVILEAMQFFPRDLAEFGIETLAALTGEDFGLDRHMWWEWIGPRLDEYAPPSGYALWKVNLLSLIDPAMGKLMEPAIEGGTRANLVEIVWGGVRVDGIPPLEQPLHVKPEMAGYLEPDDRVFGVSISGEHRAYPLRILNAHELANDELGGEPISLVY